MHPRKSIKKTKIQFNYIYNKIIMGPLADWDARMDILSELSR